MKTTLAPGMSSSGALIVLNADATQAVCCSCGLCLGVTNFYLKSV